MNRTDKAPIGFLATGLATLAVASTHLLFGQRLNLLDPLVGDRELLRAVVGALVYLLIVAFGHLIVAMVILVESRTLDSQVHRVKFDEALRESSGFFLMILASAAVVLFLAEAGLA